MSTPTASFKKRAGGEDAAAAERLVDEAIQRWHDGEAPDADAVLARHPELRDQGEAAVRLIYEEVCLRTVAGEDVPVEAVLDRYPQWRKKSCLVQNSPSKVTSDARSKIPSRIFHRRRRPPRAHRMFCSS